MRSLVLFPLFWSSVTYGLTSKQVVDSSLEFYPKVIEAVFEVERQENEVRAARGAFDAKLKGDVDVRTRGYYDGDAYKGQVVKPLPYLNTEIYGGFRQSYGDFPVYEGKYETLDEGEGFAGVSVSLLRDALIDERRFKIRKTKQDQIQAEQARDRVKITVQTMALQAYWTWVIRGQELSVAQNILGLAQKRVAQINRRIKVGDLAEIYGAENQQYIRTREARVQQALLDFQNAAYELSLFYRDSDGRPIVVSRESLPSRQDKKLATINSYEEVLSPALQNSLDLKILESQDLQAQLDIRMGTNAILPKVDVNFEWNQDQTQGIPQRNQDENRIMLKLEVPLEYRKGLGQRRAGQFKQQQVKMKAGFMRDKIKAKSQALTMKLNALAEVYRLTLDQVALAKRLAKAEMRKFNQGASDLILVNIREDSLAKAQIKNLETLLKYHRVEAEIMGLKVEFL